jgi:serine/threonine protein kinase
MESRKCLDDKELRAAELSLDWWSGQPYCVTGDSAVVYQLITKKQSFAIKCYTTDIPSLIEHYQQLQMFFYSRRNQLFVSPEIIPKGIQISKQRFPILKMDWVEGKTLRQYVSENINKPNVLLETAHKLAQAAAVLRDYNFVHGTVNPDNVLVTKDVLKLVDYDFSFGAGIQMPLYRPAESLFLHPQCKDGSSLNDNFAFHVLCTTLIVLAFEPQRLRQSDGLVFQQEDFKDREGSQLFAHLLQHPHGKVRETCQRLAEVLTMPPDDVPGVEPGAVSTDIPLIAVPKWLKSDIGSQGETTALDHGQDQRQNEVTTLRDYRTELQEVLSSIKPSSQPGQVNVLGLTPAVARIIAPVSIILMLCSLVAMAHYFWLSVLFDLSMILANVGLWYHLYSIDPEIHAMRASQESLTSSLTRLHSIQEYLSELASQIDYDGRVLDTEVVEELKRQKTICISASSQLATIRGAVSQKLAALATAHQARIALLSETRRGDVSDLESSVGKRLGEIKEDLSEIAVKEAMELNVALESAQRQYLERELRNCTIVSSSVMAIDENTAGLLSVSGVKSAWDVDDSRLSTVNGLKQSAHKSLVHWRRYHEKQAELTKPVFLNAAEKASATKELNRTRNQLLQERKRLEEHYDQQREEIEELHRIASLQLERLRGQADAQARRDAEIESWQSSLDCAVTESKRLEQHIAVERARLSKIRAEIEDGKRDCVSKVQTLEGMLESSAPASFKEYVRGLLRYSGRSRANNA